MRRALLILLACVACTLSANGQQRHTVQRGETPTSIANKYGVRPEALIELNPLLQMGCHVGMELDIPARPSFGSAGEGNLLADFDAVYSDLREADKAYDEMNYQKARRYYTKVLQSWPNDAEVLYNRGLCYYQLRKYSKAIDDFHDAINCDTRGETAQKARQMKDRSWKLKEERDERRSEIWKGVAVAAAGTALIAGTAIVASQLQPTTNTPAISAPSYAWTGNSGGISMSDLDRIDAYARREYVANTNAYYSMSSMLLANEKRKTAEYEANLQQTFAEIEWKMKSDNPVTLVFPEVEKDYKENAGQYFSEWDRKVRYSAIFEKRYNRAPSELELNYFEEKFNYMVSAMAAMYEASTKGYGADNQGFSSDSSISISSGSQDYLSEYRRLEERVKDVFGSMESVGGYVSVSGNSFSADSKNLSGVNSQMSSLVRSNQREMARVRQEAAKHGISIPISSWETMQVTYH